MFKQTTTNAAAAACRLLPLDDSIVTKFAAMIVYDVGDTIAKKLTAKVLSEIVAAGGPEIADILAKDDQYHVGGWPPARGEKCAMMKLRRYLCEYLRTRVSRKVYETMVANDDRSKVQQTLRHDAKRQKTDGEWTLAREPGLRGVTLWRAHAEVWSLQRLQRAVDRIAAFIMMRAYAKWEWVAETKTAKDAKNEDRRLRLAGIRTTEYDAEVDQGLLVRK